MVRTPSPKDQECKIVRSLQEALSCARFSKRLRSAKSFLITSLQLFLVGLCTVWNRSESNLHSFELEHQEVVSTHVYPAKSRFAQLVTDGWFHPHNDGIFYSASGGFNLRCTTIETNMTEDIDIMTKGPRPMGGSYTALDVNSTKQLVMIGDNSGIIHMVDSRTNRRTGDSFALHTGRTSILGIHCHPYHADTFLTCGYDHYVKLWDVRMMGSTTRNKERKNFVRAYYHEGPVNSAYFSPQSGSKIVTTCRESYIRVFSKDGARSIAHSHIGNASVSPFQAEWDPRDPYDSVVVIGRYRDNGVGQHPIDFIDTSPEATETGNLVAELTNEKIKTFCPINKIHPRENILATASGRSLFLWKPRGEDDEPRGEDVE